MALPSKSRAGRYLAALVMVLVAATAGLPGAGAAPSSIARADKVLVFSVPDLTWQAVIDERPPVLTAFLERSAVASLSVRTIGPRTSLGEAYATIGAGNRASGGEELGDVLAVGAAGGGITVAGLPAVQEANEALPFGARPGALGQALAAAGYETAVVANADVAVAGRGVVAHREAALAVMDARGQVAAGSVSPALSVEDATAPGGRRSDVGATAAAVTEAWERAEVVLVEASDLARLHLLAGSEAGLPAGARRAALARADELLGAALGQVDLDRHLVVVVAPTSGGTGRDGLTVAALAGPGVLPGLATSASTNRAGYVVLPDVTPTALRALGVEVPATVTGVAMSSSGGGPPGPARLAELAEANEIATFRDRATGPFTVSFIGFQLLVYALAALALGRWPRLRPAVAFLALVALAQPPLTYLSGLFRYDRLGVAGYVVVMFLAATALAAGALGMARSSAARTGRAQPLVAPLLLVGLTLAVLVADIVAGGSLQLNTVFGYSPVVAGRFAGYGNQAFALVSMAALIVVSGIWAGGGLRRRGPVPGETPRRAALVAAGAVLAVVIVADGHPALGADVGGVLALVPAALVVLLLLAGRRVGPVHVAAMAGAAAVVLAGFAALDLARPAAERTHIGRFAARVLGGTGVGTVLERKIDANLSLLFSSVWTLIIPFGLAFLAVLVWRGPGVLRQLQGALPGFRALLVGAVVLAVLGGLVNDSGVAVPAMMLAVLLPYVTVLAMAFATRS